MLLHEGGYQSGTINGCEGISAPIAQIAAQMTAEVDQIVSGHTHQGYICSLPPRGQPATGDQRRRLRPGRDRDDLTKHPQRRRHQGEVQRGQPPGQPRHQGPRADRDHRQVEHLAGPLKASIVGTHTEDILGDSSGNRGIETPMGDAVADAILWGTEGDKGGAQIAFMNVGGVREDLPMAPKYGEAPGQITFAEAFDIAPSATCSTRST